MLVKAKRAQKRNERSTIKPKGYEIKRKKPNRQAPSQKSLLSKHKKGNMISKLKIFGVHSGMDLPFLFLVFAILLIGLIMLFSASYPNAYYLHNGDSFFFIKRQLIFAVIGIFTMFAVSYFDYNNFHKHKLVLTVLTVSFVLLIAVLFMPARNGVHRWIQIGFLDFQSSEITKFAIVLSFAHFININFNRMHTFKYGILPYLMILAPTVILLVLEPHISCTVIIVLLAAGMLFIGGVKLKWFGVVLGAIASALFYLVVFTDKLTYGNDRIAGWLDPFGTSSGVDTWQTRQGLYAIGSGGVLGLGLGQSRQKYLFLPEPHNDFIFAVVCEELGFVGAVIILLLFALLIWRGMLISMKAKDRFGLLLGVGLTAQVGLQVILNIAVVTNTIPNTGIALPFFSYGGTSLLMLLAQMGIILSISRTAKLEKS